MKKLLTICAVVAFVLALSGLAQADTRYVGPGETYTTIQAAISAANAGDIIIVAPGTYVEYTGTPGAGCALTIPWFADGAGGLTIESSGGAANTIIDCGTAAWGVQMVSNQITFTGFTVKNAYSVINQVSGKDHNLSNLVITDFVNYGLGVYAGDGCTFSNVTIHTNDVASSNNRIVKGIDMQGYGSGGNTNNTFEDITICDIETTGDYGTSMGIWWSTSYTYPDANNAFTNLTIHDITAPEWAACGVYIMGQLSGTTPYAIENTTFSGGSIYNIGGGTLYARGIYVAHGRCKDLSISGFDIFGCSEGILIRNQGNDACVNVDILCNNIVGNTVYGVQNYEEDNDVDATGNWWGNASGPSGVGPGTGDAVSAYVAYEPWTPGYACSSFEPPMDKGAVKVKKNRVLPLKAELLDVGGNILTDAEITTPPVIQVIFTSTVGCAADVTDQALSAGHGTDGNQFEFSGVKWQYNLQTKNYTAKGTYTVTMVSGDECEYGIESSCTATFVIE
jgi:hypothetical protein